MELFRDPKILKDRAFVLGMFTVFFLIAPGIACIYLYFPEYIVELDAIKLILLSITCTMPLAVINAVTIGIAMERKKEKNDDLFYDFVLGAILGGILIYLAIIGSYLASFTARQLSGVVLIVEMLLLISIWFEGKKMRKGK
jgi:cytochrome c biogenesis protein CcdA